MARPTPFAPPKLPPTFDRAAALSLIRELATLYPDRSPGSPGALGAARWFSAQLAPYGFRTRRDSFFANIPGRGRVLLRNILAVSPGRSPNAIVVMAHRDDMGSGPGANDNASGTAALIELARAYSNPPSAAPRTVSPAHTVIFLSTDAGAFGGLGAEHFVRTSRYRERVVAVVNLDSLAGRGQPRLEIAGDSARSPAGVLVETAAARVLEQTGSSPGRTSALGQLIDLGFPFSLYEQAPFVRRGIPAVTLTTGGNRSPGSLDDVVERVSSPRLAELGRSAQGLVESLDQGLDLAHGSSSYLYLGSRLVRGWAIELALIVALLPFLAATVDLFAWCRRRRLRLAPALRSYRSRLGVWLWTGGLFGVFALVGVWPKGAPRPPNPETEAATSWPVLGLGGLLVLAGIGWIVARERLVPRRPVTAEEELAGYSATLLVLGVVALLVAATNPFALIFVLPSLHSWLWLPQARDRSAWARAAVLLAGFAGPLLLLGSFASRFELGLDAPWYVGELAALRYVPLHTVLIVLAWLAAAAQLTALATGRYAPYPSAAERPPRGPIRELIRRTVRAVRARRGQDNMQIAR